MRIIMHDQIEKRQNLISQELRSSGIAPEIIPLDGVAAGTAGVDELASDLLPVLLGFEPDYDVVGFMRELRSEGSRSPVLVMQKGLDPRQISRILDAGADDVLTGSVSAVEVASRIRAIARRGFGVRQDFIKIGSLLVYLDGRNPEINGEPVKLSPTENTILSMLAFNAGKVVRRDVIFDTLYTLSDYQPHMKAVELHIHKLRKKLAPLSDQEKGGIRTYSGQGYCLDVPTTDSD